MEENWGILDEKDSLQALLVRAIHKYYAMCFKDMRKLDIHPGQVPILKVLHSKPGLSQKELAQKLNIKPPTVNVTVKRLESAGYLRRESDRADQRTTRIYLTEQGNSINEDIEKFFTGTEEILSEGFSESELCLFRQFFRQMLENMEYSIEGVGQKR